MPSTPIDWQRIDELIRRMVDEKNKVSRLYAKATNITTQLSDMPHGGSSMNPTEDRNIAYAEGRATLDEHKAELKRWQDIIRPLIEKHLFGKVQEAMRLRYLSVDGWSVNRVSNKMLLDRRYIYMLLDDGKDILNKKIMDR